VAPGAVPEDDGDEVFEVITIEGGSIGAEMHADVVGRGGGCFGNGVELREV